MAPRPFPSSSHRDSAESGSAPDNAPPSPHGGREPEAEEQQPEEHHQDVVLTDLWCQMLIDLYELPQALPESFPGQPISPEVWRDLRQGTAPSQAALSQLPAEWRAELRLQTGCACGYRHLQAIGYDDVCERVNALQERGDEGAYLGGCLYLLLSLVLTLPPSEAMVRRLTNSFSNAEADLERSEQFLFELVLALLARHTQDVLRSLSGNDQDDEVDDEVENETP